MLRDLLDDDDPSIAAILMVIAQVRPDVLVLTDFDYDADGLAAAAFQTRLGAHGLEFEHMYFQPPNSVHMTSLDLDGDGYLGGNDDRQGFGRFAGDEGMLVLSRLPIDHASSHDYSAITWSSLSWATLPVNDGAPFPSPAAQQLQRLSSSGHWQVTFVPDNANPFSVLIHNATPPVFDGPEDRNGLRAKDELAFWSHFIDGAFGPAPEHFVLAANTNLDPNDGDGHSNAMAHLLSSPALIDAQPSSRGAAEQYDPSQSGPAALDTANWPEVDGPGNLRVSYVLPSSNWDVLGSGVFWPPTAGKDAWILGQDGLAAGPHHLVWVDVRR